jgi:hypothetical protein
MQATPPPVDAPPRSGWAKFGTTVGDFVFSSQFYSASIAATIAINVLCIYTKRDPLLGFLLSLPLRIINMAPEQGTKDNNRMGAYILNCMALIGKCGARRYHPLCGIMDLTRLYYSLRYPYNSLADLPPDSRPNSTEIG